MLLRTTCILLFAGLLRADDPSAKKPKTVRLLTVGNSFSGNATSQLGNLVKASGHTLIHQPMSIGGASMVTHLTRVERHEKDPKDPAGLYGTKNLKDELKAQPWDFITIQQASIQSHNIDNYRPSAKQLHDVIKQNAPKAEILIHQTWAYRVDDPRFTRKETPKGEPATRQEMYEMLTKAYDTIAKELGLRVIPVGDAFHLADSDPKWGYRPDKKYDHSAAKKPDLPDQAHSLHSGWSWGKDKDGKDKLNIDGHHASTAGQYLAACVWFEFLFDESAVGNKYIPAKMDVDYARFLQETAHKAVALRKAVQKKASSVP